METSASGGTGGRLLSLPSAPSSSSLTKVEVEQTVRRVTVSSAVSLIAFSAMALLAFLEFFVYRDTWMKYEYEVDKDFSRYVLLNLRPGHSPSLFVTCMFFTSSCKKKK